MQGVAGLEHPRKKNYRNLNDRVQRTVSAYGQSEVLLYLRAISHFSRVEHCMNLYFEYQP